MPVSKLSLCSYFVVLAWTALQVSAYSYIGCVDSSQGSAGAGSTTIGSIEKCAAYCEPSGDKAPFFYYRADGEVCTCSNVSPAPGSYVPAQGSQGGCSATSYAAYSILTTFEFQGCDSNMDTDENPGDNFASLETCFAECADKGSVMFNPYYNDDTFGCRCNSAYTITGGSAATCGPYSWFTYVHSKGATASGLARRNYRVRAEQARLARQTFCPQGAKACSVDGNPDTYECVDIETELESCGGCLYGEFQSTAVNATAGVDCTALPGVALGGVTCESSACIAYACRTGFELSSGVCVPHA
ncbi:hypothetical protein IAT40_000086 [Kwoniella sp. CBS 6097]